MCTLAAAAAIECSKHMSSNDTSTTEPHTVVCMVRGGVGWGREALAEGHTCKCVDAVLAGRSAVQISDKACEAADAVAAHLRLTAVTVVDAHRQVCFSCRRQRKDDLRSMGGPERQLIGWCHRGASA